MCEERKLVGKMVKSRYWQVVRGICILAVIMIHCPMGQSGVDQTVWLALRQFINFPVAIFIFMAGYFVKPDKVNSTYLKNRGGGYLSHSCCGAHCTLLKMPCLMM